MSWSQENKDILRYLAFITVIAVLISYLLPNPVDWSPSFEKDSEKPYGSLILHDELQEIFPNDSIKVNTVPFYNGIGKEDYTNHNLIIIDQEFRPDSLDLAQLYKFVQSGNNAFIAAQDMSIDLFDSLRLTHNTRFTPGFITDINSDAIDQKFNFYNDLKQDTAYRFKTARIYSYFDDDFAPSSLHSDSVQHDVKAITKIAHLNSTHSFSEEEYLKTNFVRVKYGKGSFFLHLFPYAFTNHSMLKSNINEYVAKCLSYLPKQKTIWDEYYKPGGGALAGASPLRVFLGSKALKWAYWLGFMTLLLFMIFYAKRRQRIIPVLEPYKNESLDFTKTIAALYFEKHNNTDLAKKKARYFRDYVSRKFYLKHFNVNEQGLQDLLGKSSYDRDQLSDLFDWVNKAEHKRISDRELIEISKRLNHFYRDN